MGSLGFRIRYCSMTVFTFVSSDVVSSDDVKSDMVHDSDLARLQDGFSGKIPRFGKYVIAQFLTLTTLAGITLFPFIRCARCRLGCMSCKINLLLLFRCVVCE
jgi:hypothetical protein